MKALKTTFARAARKWGAPLAAGAAVTAATTCLRPPQEVNPGRAGGVTESCLAPRSANAQSLCTAFAPSAGYRIFWAAGAGLQCLLLASAFRMGARAARRAARGRERLRGAVLPVLAPAAVAAAPAAMLATGPLPYEFVTTYPLTGSERQLVADVFGDRVDASRARLHFASGVHAAWGTNQGASMHFFTWSETVAVYDPRYIAADYARADAAGFSSFLHEMLHLYQKQNYDPPRPACAVDYSYSLRARMDFMDLACDEPQAAAMEDYARRFLHPARSTRWLKRRYGEDSEPLDDALRNMVETQFPRARETRMAVEAGRRRYGPPPVMATRAP